MAYTLSIAEEHTMAKERINRREFMGRTGLGLLGTGIGLPLMKTGCSKSQEKSGLIYRTLGRTGLRVPVLSFGVMNTHSEPLLLKARRLSTDAGLL